MDAFQRSIAQSLRQVADGGTRIYLMHGNRDFLIGKAFCREAGCTLLPDPSVIDLYGEPVLLMHGDSLCTRDGPTCACAAGCATRSRSGYCATCRWPPGTSCTQARKESRAQTRMKAVDIIDVTPEEVPGSCAGMACVP